MTEHLTHESIIDYAHGFLAPDADAHAFAHIQICMDCRSLYQEELHISEILRSRAYAQERAMPESLQQAIRSSVILAAKPRSFFSELLGAMRPLVMVPVAAIFIAIFGGTVAWQLHPASINETGIPIAAYIDSYKTASAQMPFADRTNVTPFESTALVTGESTSVDQSI